MSLILVETKPCPGCDETKELEVDSEALRRWKRGAFIQDALPELSADDRERLVTGYCSQCWDKLMGPEF